MGVPRIDYERMKAAIAANLYDNIVHGTSLYMSTEEIGDAVGVTENVSRLCTRLLIDAKLVIEGQKRQEIRSAFGVATKPEFEMVGTGNFTLTAKGREFVESMTDATYDSVVSTHAEDTHEDWTPLEFDRPDQEATAAAESIDELIEKVKSDNGYAASEPAEREAVVSRLTQASDWLRNAEYITASSLQAYVIWPLEKLATRFSMSTAVGAATKFTIGIITAWLKSRGLKTLDGMFD